MSNNPFDPFDPFGLDPFDPNPWPDPMEALDPLQQIPAIETVEPVDMPNYSNPEPLNPEPLTDLSEPVTDISEPLTHAPEEVQPEPVEIHPEAIQPEPGTPAKPEEPSKARSEPPQPREYHGHEPGPSLRRGRRARRRGLDMPRQRVRPVILRKECPAGSEEPGLLDCLDCIWFAPDLEELCLLKLADSVKDPDEG